MRRKFIASTAVILVASACGGGRSDPALEPSGSAAASSRSSCAAVDTSHSLGSPVYRECGVDQRARVRGQAGRMEFRPASASPSCYSATVEMVVDERGEPLPATARIVRATTVDFGEAALSASLRTRYHPARKAGEPVKQVVEVKHAAVLSVRAAGQPAPSRPPRVTC